MALTTCSECQGRISTEAASCPHCGAPMPARTDDATQAAAHIDIAPARGGNGKVIAVLVIGGLVFLAILVGKFFGSSDSTTSVRPAAQDQRNLASLVGTDCSVADMASMAPDAATAYEMAKAIAKDDRSNAVALLASGKITPIEGGGKARVIDSDWTKSALKVRITSGRFLGREGWVSEGMCK